MQEGVQRNSKFFLSDYKNDKLLIILSKNFVLKNICISKDFNKCWTFECSNDIIPEM